MKNNDIIQVKTLLQYYQKAGLGKPKHPLISVFHFEHAPKIEIKEKLRFALGFYVVTIKYECSCKSQYGQTTYDYDEGVMGFTAPNQVISVGEDFVSPDQGWCLMFHPDLLLQTELARKIKSYDFFSYEVDEALILSKEEEKDVEELFRKIEKEILRPIDNFSQDVLIAQLDLLLTYSNRFYTRQFITRKPVNHQLLTRFETLLNAWFDDKNTRTGLPSVVYFANQLNISVKYFSDMLRQLTGLTAQQHIHEKLIEKAKELLSATNLSVAEIAFELGFEHPTSFSKLFRAKTSLTPGKFRASFNE